MQIDASYVLWIGVGVVAVAGVSTAIKVVNSKKEKADRKAEKDAMLREGRNAAEEARRNRRR
jgi:prefoldin subunit 5